MEENGRCRRVASFDNEQSLFRNSDCMYCEMKRKGINGINNETSIWFEDVGGGN